MLTTTRVWISVLVVAACGSSGNGNEGNDTGESGGASSNCPPGVGAWMSTSPDPLSVGMAQFDRCYALCQQAQATACTGHDLVACGEYCNGLQNESVNGRCTELIGDLITCFETLNEACNTPQRTYPGTCAAEYEAIGCCSDRLCADPANAGRCL